MLGNSIQLTFRVVRDKTKKTLTKLSLPPNFRNNVLFNLAIKDALKNSTMDNFALQKYLLATGFLKDSIQDILNLIVNNGKFNNGSVRRVFDTKYLSMVKTSNPVNVVFKDKTKFDTQNSIIGTLLAQTELRKSKIEKAIGNQLKGALSIELLQIAEQLEQLRESNRKNNVDDDPPLPPPSLSTNKDDDSNIKNDLNLTQKLLLEDAPQQEKFALAVGEKTKAAVKKVRFSENFHKLFPKAEKIFNDQKIELDYDDLPKHEIMIPNTQTLFKELKNAKLPKELKKILGGSNHSNELKFGALENMGMLNESNKHFLHYLLSDFAKKVPAKNKMKTHLDTGNIYYNNLNMREEHLQFYAF